MLSEYIKLAIAALLPVAASGIIYFLQKRTPLGRIVPKWLHILICGVVFGALACVGTHWGISINGAMVNARDASVLTAGLMFGGPAGIIAGVIGGVERAIATQVWGIGSFTVIACSVSTFLAGVYAALLRRYMFDHKKPGWLISFAIGIVMEVFHLTMVFVTNMGEAERAMAVVKACTAPMLIANGVSVMLSAMIISLILHEKLSLRSKHVRISQRIQRELLVTVTVAFILSSVFVALFQTSSANSLADRYLANAIEETTKDISDASDAHLLRLARTAKEDFESGLTASEIARKHMLAEVHIIDKNGIITDSSEAIYVGFDMAGSEQSAEFLPLLDEEDGSLVQPYGPIGYNNAIYRKYAAVSTESGMIQIGANALGIQESIDESIVGLTKNRHVGENGYTVILDRNYIPVSAPEGFDIKQLDSQSDALNASREGETFKITLGGETMLCRAVQTEGYSIVSVFPESEALRTRNVALYVNTFMEVLIFALMFAFIYLVVKRAVVNQIKKINSSLAKITGGDLEETVNVRSSEEFASLSDDINRTVTALKGYISEAEHRMEQELEFAKTIQHSSLPLPLAARHDFDVHAEMFTAREVGGDFYDFYTRDSGSTLCFLVADVSGKGIPAAMFMMRAKTQLKGLTESGRDVSEVFTYANNTLCEGNEAGMFVTAWEGLLDLKSGKVKFANAGHNPPMIKRRSSSSFAPLRTRPGLVLAGMEDIPYREDEITLEEGDVLFLYTDGMTEGMNAAGELFGEDRLIDALNGAGNCSSEELCAAAKRALDEFVLDADQFDDITMLALIYKPDKVKKIIFDEARREDAETLADFIRDALGGTGCSSKSANKLCIAADEMFSNIVKYAYPDAPGRAEIALSADEEGRRVKLTLRDFGAPYDPLTAKEPDVTLSADEREPGGLGIFLVKRTMDGVEYRREDGANVVTLTKYYE